VGGEGTHVVTNPTDIVGHKTFDTGERDKHGMPVFRHEPLTRAEGDALWEAVETSQRERAARMPDEQSAILALQEAHTRLKELGWRDAIYCPKDGKHFKAIEAGSTGIHDCNYQGEWPKGSWWLYDNDVWPSRPILFRLYPADQAAEDAKWAEAGRRYRESVQSSND
jgi:hypothetical protein